MGVPPLSSGDYQFLIGLTYFQRGAPDRTASPDGLGLGLSIVAEIVEAHAARLQVRARSEGGLTVTPSFSAHPLSAAQVEGQFKAPAH